MSRVYDTEYVEQFIDTEGMTGLRLLLRLLVEQWRPILAGVAALFFVDSLQILVIPTVIQRTINRLSDATATPSILYAGALAIAGAAFGMAIGRFAWRYFLVGTSYRIERDVRDVLYRHLQSLPPEYYDRQKVGDITAHASNDTRAIQRACGFGTLAAIDGLVMALGVISLMLYKNAHLTIFVLLPLPFLSFIVVRFGRLVHARFEKVQEAFSHMTERAQEAFSAVRVVKAYGDEESEHSFFTARAKEYVDENITLARIFAVFDPAIFAIATLSMALLTGVGGTMVINGSLTLGEFVAFSTYLGMLTWPMIAVGVVVNLLQRGAASMERIMRILRVPPAIRSGARGLEGTPRIDVSHLSFTYPETTEQVLRDVSFALPPGDFLGVVGKTGCGKTTLIELLMRLYDPPKGTIHCDDTPLHDLRLSDLRALYGYVPQDPFLFAMSVADNIRFGAGALEDEEVERYAKIVRLHDEILTFPDGYETLVGERGITLSGGQKQRVSIARALATKPRILVLDDALSSVDAETEKAILHELATVMKETTCIVVAHRISAVMDATSILVMANGTIVDRGSHEELIGRAGYYRDLYHLQSLESSQSAS